LPDGSAISNRGVAFSKKGIRMTIPPPDN
jgi:hypothetical protein